MGTVPMVMLRDPLTYRLQLQQEDYAWKIDLIAMDFVTREEMNAWVFDLIMKLQSHIHTDSTGKPTSTSLTVFPLVVDNLALAGVPIAKRAPWRAAGAIDSPLELLSKT